MRTTVTNAKVLIEILTAGVSAAEAKGETDFELTSALQAFDATTRQELVDAIEDAKK